MEYFSHKKPRIQHDHAEVETPVLNEEDEAFLQRITSEGEPPPLPARPQNLAVAGDSRGNDAQLALMDGAQNIPLPDVPDTPDDVMAGFEGEGSGKGKEKGKDRKKHWSFLRRDSRDSKRRDRQAAGTDLEGVAQGLKSPSARPNEDGSITPREASKEEEEMTEVLDQLNLAAVNNRVFSFSRESQELLRKFTLVLKDLVNGVPTAYDDLESLITNSENQLQDGFKHLPSFLQKLIQQIPGKFTESLTPELMAGMGVAAAEKPSFKNNLLSKSAGAAAIASKLGMKVKVPALKELVTKPGAVAGMLRTIMQFLRARFPAFMGMNVLWSLALFLLLFVFWYCHKRGREVRLEKERLLTEGEVARLEAQIATDPAAEWTTTAPEGAPIEEVHAGLQPFNATPGRPSSSGSASYAPSGSLARDFAAKDKAGADVRIRELDEDSVAAGSSRVQHRRHKTKEERRRLRSQNAPSNAPLDRQESCVLS